MSGYQKVYLRVAGLVGDTSGDEDDKPDRVLATGSGSFVPTLPESSGDVQRGPDGLEEIMLPDSVQFTIVDGMVTQGGRPYVWLPVPSGSWMWQIEFNRVQIGSRNWVLKSFSFPLTAATQAQENDPAYVGINLAYYAVGAWSPGEVEALSRRMGDLETAILATQREAAAATAARYAAEAAAGSANGVPGSVRPEQFGAVRDGVTDDSAAINQAIAAVSATGGSVDFSPGVYAVASPVQMVDDSIVGVHLRGSGEHVTIIRSIANVPVISGAWMHSRISNLVLDAGLHGSPCVSAHFDKVSFVDNVLMNWNGEALRLNDGTYGDLGLLNYVTRNHIFQSTGTGIWTSYRFIDSWITENNIGSTGSNISLEGGPVRVLANHLNGAPTHNLELRGNKRITVADNIMEGALESSIIYTMPPWLAEDAPQVQITGNAISNGGKVEAFALPAIHITGVGPSALVSGFSIVGNIFSCEDPGSGWNYAILALDAEKVTITGNQWGRGISHSDTPIGRSQNRPASAVVAVGNAGGDGVALI